MPVIYLRHPKHGAKVAISWLEAQNDFEHGWEEFDPTERSNIENDSPPAPVVLSDAPAPAQELLVEPINELQPRRRGRRPREIVE